MHHRINNHTVFELTDKSPKIEATPLLSDENVTLGFYDIELFDHQKTIVHAYLELEDRRMFTTNNFFTKVTRCPSHLQTNAIVISEPFGSGKTFEILTIIMLRPIPRAIPEFVNHFKPLNPKCKDFKTEVIRVFTGNNSLIKCNVIVVGSSVLEQWAATIKAHTNFRVFTISNYYSLMAFIKLYNLHQMNNYDIVLVKYANFTGDLRLPGDIGKCEYRNLVTAVAVLTGDRCWARAIYDDIDIISTHSDIPCINALMTLFVSATEKTPGKSTRARPTPEHRTIYDLLKTQPRITSFIADKTLFTMFNIRNTREYTEASTNITVFNQYKCVYKNKDDKYMYLLGQMGDDDARDIAEMLNADAIETAADAMGIKTTSVANIFQRVLDKKYTTYLHDTKLLENIERLRAAPLQPHPKDKRHSVLKLQKIKSRLSNITTDQYMDLCGYSSVTLTQMLDEYQVEVAASKEQNGLAINRVLDNVREGACQVCCLPLDGTDILIVKCCGLTLCDQCGIKGNQIKMTYDPRRRMDILMGQCANCKAIIYPNIDLIFLNKDSNLLKEMIEGPGATDFKEEEPQPQDRSKNPKLWALLDIIQGKLPEGCIPNNLVVPHLLQGRVNIPPSPTDPRKILLFANFNETLNNIEKFLIENNVAYMRLKGTHKELANTLREFRNNDIPILLINSQVHCAGINMEFATHIVFFHKIVNPSLQGQVIGRGQRPGRKANLQVIWIQYENELAMKFAEEKRAYAA